MNCAGTSALHASQQFTRPGPSVAVALCYGASLVLISLTFRTIPIGVVYAIWSGLGIVMVVVMGWVVFGQRLDLPTLCGVALILLSRRRGPILHSYGTWTRLLV